MEGPNPESEDVHRGMTDLRRKLMASGYFVQTLTTYSFQKRPIMNQLTLRTFKATLVCLVVSFLSITAQANARALHF